MKIFKFFAIVIATSAVAAQPVFVSKREVTVGETKELPLSTDNDLHLSYGKPYAIFQPKVFIVSMFELERDPWLEALDFVHNISLPGLSPIYSTIYCTTNYSICQATAGEGEINAASSLTALTLSPLFDLTKTYWLLAGISGGEPTQVTTGSATFAKYAIQVGLQYQIDYREYINTNPDWISGYIPYGTDNPYTYPGNVYGTEVFELNEKLRNRALELASNVQLDNGTEKNAEFRALYEVEPAISPPTVVGCDVLTSDNYFTGNVLNDYFANLTKLMTNGSATYCSTAQEDNASLEVFTRMQKYGLVDYERIVVLRTISNFSRPPPSMANNTVKFFTDTDKGGIGHSLANLVNAGFPFIHDVLTNWENVYESGETYEADNYVGDIFGSVGGKPDFGKDSFEIA